MRNTTSVHVLMEPVVSSVIFACEVIAMWTPFMTKMVDRRRSECIVADLWASQPYPRVINDGALYQIVRQEVTPRTPAFRVGSPLLS